MMDYYLDRTKDIIDDLRQSHFRNWWEWDYDECRRFVLSRYICSYKVARKVALEITNWR